MPTGCYPVLVISGPTASGKSELALDLAEDLGGEIVNYDSVQVFRGLDIGTAKPSRSDQKRIPHHLIDILEPDEVSSAGDYQRRARAALGEIRSKNKLPILVGGTGLYLRAVMDGLFDGPARSAYWRSRMQAIAEARGREHLHSILKRMDAVSARRIAPRDLPKVVRALEVRLSTGRALSTYLEEAPRHPAPGFDFHLVGLDPPRGALYARIGARVRRMFEAGLVSEIRGILERGVSPASHAFRAIGYRRVLEYIDGAISLDEAIIMTERDTRRYAKRQLTWFRRQHSVAWFDGFGNEEDTKQRVHRFIDHSLNAGGIALEGSGGSGCHSG